MQIFCFDSCSKIFHISVLEHKNLSKNKIEKFNLFAEI